MSDFNVDKLVSGLKQELNHSPWFFLKWKTQHLRDQTSYTYAQKEKIDTWLSIHHELALAKEKFDHATQVEKISFQVSIEQGIAAVEAAKLNTKLTLLAGEMGLDLIDFGLVRKEQLMNVIALDKQRQEAEIRGVEDRQKKELEDEMEERKANRIIRTALAYKNLNWAEANEVLRELIRLEDERHAFRFSGKPMALIASTLRHMDRHIEAKENEHTRLLQGGKQEIVRSSDEDALLRRYTQPNLDTGAKQVPDKNT